MLSPRFDKENLSAHSLPVLSLSSSKSMPLEEIPDSLYSPNSFRNSHLKAMAHDTTILASSDTTILAPSDTTRLSPPDTSLLLQSTDLPSDGVTCTSSSLPLDQPPRTRPNSYVRPKTTPSPRRRLGMDFSHRSEPEEVSVISTELSRLELEHESLSKQYADALVSIAQLEQKVLLLSNDLSSRDDYILELTHNMLHLQDEMHRVRNDHLSKLSSMTDEIDAYKKAIRDLNASVSDLSAQVARYQTRELEGSLSSSGSALPLLSNPKSPDANLPEKYTSLLKDYRILSSSYELERDAKLALIRELEYKTGTAVEVPSPVHPQLSADELPRSVNHTMNDLTDDDNDSGANISMQLLDVCPVLDAAGPFPSRVATCVNSSSGGNPPFVNPSSVNPASVNPASVNPTSVNPSNPTAEKFPRNRPHLSHTALKFVLDDYIQVNPQYQSPRPVTKTKRGSIAIDSAATNTQGCRSVPLAATPCFESREFTLSPLRLAAGNYFDDPRKPVTRRYSASKPHHSRYNSHDIVPIMVEFEQMSPDTKRSTLLQEQRNSYSRRLANRNLMMRRMQGPARDSVTSADGLTSDAESTCSRAAAAVRGEAFNVLLGIGGTAAVPGASSDHSFTELLTRLSVVTEHGLQLPEQVTKLKFEIQSLKLQNEKLLSYIGFQLQLQKKTIKKLSSKKSLRALCAAASAGNFTKLLSDAASSSNFPKPGEAGSAGDPDNVSAPANPADMEYSDAVLIELGRDELIKKKRYLRLVSINPILSKNFGAVNSPSTDPMLAFGLHEYEKTKRSAQDSAIVGGSDDEEEGDGDDNDSDDDDYGFLKFRETHRLRRFSKGLEIYLNLDKDPHHYDGDGGGDGGGGGNGVGWLACSSGSEEDYTGSGGRRKRNSIIMRKCKSQDFAQSRRNFESDGESERVMERGGEGDFAGGSKESLVIGLLSLEDEEVGIFEHFKHIIIGTQGLSEKKRKRLEQPLVDDGMKLKFLTATIAIMIIGLQFHPKRKAL